MECCDVCGDIGVTDALITCSQCKTNREHVYCMKTLLDDPIDDWCCEECQSSSNPSPLASSLTEHLPGTPKSTNSKVHAESRKSKNESRKGSFDWEKKVASGKAKYICVKEAIMLSSGEKKSLVPSNFSHQSRSPRPKIGVNKPERAPIRPATVPLSFSSQQDLSQRLKAQRPGNIEIFKGQLQQSKILTESQRSVSSLRPSQGPQNKQPAEDKLLQTKVPSLTKKPCYGSAPSQNASPVTISGGNDRNTVELRTRNAANVSINPWPNSEIYSRAPALDALWKGSLGIQDNHKREGLNHRIQAHPPSQVRRKIYEFSKRMPKVLHFEFVPFKNLSINLFREYIPDQRDIGLYFLPGDGERYEDYIFLLESINAKELALRKQIGDIELLVFTSKLLPFNCQCWKGKYFLWGLFHHMKRDITSRVDCKGQQLSSTQPSDDIDGCNQGNDSAEVDMDIDMIGGVNVGRIDFRGQREPPREKCESLRQVSATATDHSANKQISSVSRRDFDRMTAVLSQKVKVEPPDNIPPGFEEKCKSMIQGFHR